VTASGRPPGRCQ